MLTFLNERIRIIKGLNIMNFFDKIIHFFQENYIPLDEESGLCETTVKPNHRKSFEPLVNPATGMPMIGSVDCMGNPFGQRSIPEINYSSSSDYYRNQSSYQSFSYCDNRWNDPFNRY